MRFWKKYSARIRSGAPVAAAKRWFMACRKERARSPDTPIDGNVP